MRTHSPYRFWDTFTLQLSRGYRRSSAVPKCKIMSSEVSHVLRQLFFFLWIIQLTARNTSWWRLHTWPACRSQLPGVSDFHLFLQLPWAIGSIALGDYFGFISIVMSGLHCMNGLLQHVRKIAIVLILDISPPSGPWESVPLRMSFEMEPRPATIRALVVKQGEIAKYGLFPVVSCVPVLRNFIFI